MQKAIWSVLVAGALALPLQAVASPGVILGSDTIDAGDAASIEMSFDADGVVAGLDFRFTFDDAQFTATANCVSTLPTTNPNANASVLCSVSGNTVSVIVSAAFAIPVPPISTGVQSLGTVSFQSQGSTPAADYALTITESNFFDASSSPVTGSGNTNGQITVSPPPAPAWTSNPAAGDSIALGTSNSFMRVVGITNTGDVGSTLSGECSLSGDSAISIATGGGAYSVAANSGHEVTLSCSTATADTSYNATLSCTHDASNIASPATWPVTCTVPALPPAVFGSNPAAGSTIDTTPGDVKVGDTLGTVPLVISNDAAVGSQDLGITSCSVGGTDASKFTVTGGPADGSTIAAGAQVAATVACNDASAAATYNGTYSCSYTGTASPGTATWNLLCEVRASESAVAPSPGDGSTLVRRVSPGGSADFVVTFSETANEGVDGEVTACTLGDTTNFALNTSLPVAVPAGGSVQVSVTGTDPGDVPTISTTLDCTYTDSANPNGTSVSYTLTLTKVVPKVPTLSQWGLILLSLLMLGTGLIGFRRFAS